MRLKGILLVSTFILSGCVSSGGGNQNQQDGGATTSGSSVELEQFRIGNSVKVGDVVYQINSADNTKRVGGEYLYEETSNNFVVLNLTVKNVGNDELTLISGMIELHAGDKKYEPHSSGIYLDDGFYVLVTIGADLSKTVNVVYETPSEYTADYYLSVKPSSSSYKTAKIYLK